MPDPSVMIAVGLLLMVGLGRLAYNNSKAGRTWLVALNLVAIIIIAFGVGVNFAIWYVGTR